MTRWNALAGYRRDWVGELMTLAAYRLVSIATSTAIVGGIAIVSPFAARATVMALHAVWLTTGIVMALLQARTASPHVAVRLGTAAWIIDALLLGSIMALSGPAWWFGLVYLTLIGSMGMITLPSRARLWVLGVCWCVAIGLAYAQGSGALPGDAWIDAISLPSWFRAMVPVLSGGLPLIAFAWQQQLTLQRLESGLHDYRRVVHLAPDPMWMMTRDGTVLAMNAAAERLTGRDFDALVGRSLLDTIVEADQRHVCDALAEPLSEDRRHIEFCMHPPDRDRVHLDVTLVPVHDDHGHPVVLGLARDITTVRETQQARAELQVERERSHALRRMARVVGRMAHELNNPIGAILTALESSAPPQAPGTFSELQPVLTERTRDVQRVLHDLLIATSPVRPVAAERVALHELLETLIAKHAETAAAREIVFTLSAHHPAPDVAGDSTLLERALEHLLINALEASITGGRILVSIVEADGGVALHIVNGGSSLPPGIRQRLFEPFVTTKRDGFGLGLPFARNVVVAHSGSLRVSDRDDMPGVAVAVWLPAILVAEPTSVAATARRPSAQRVLIVEDEGAIAEALSRYLRRHGWIVLTASTVDAAMEQLRNPESGALPDVILSDVCLPGPTGLDLLSYVQAHHPDLHSRFIFVTGDTSSPDVANGLAAAHVPVVLKPFSLRELHQLMTDLDGRSSDSA